ncbi:hypothetical protein SHI21_16345 [Bacteriovorax sp. PP10]|uniref:Uncharacterized protein n=1 Tax=Bacteriovorax antarcticus TaxID=3088717 RepID=A0ABU5VZK2_9BACT|nr:hypothetical protein [Bacteriovorax sp. PP10]MEA9357803.1 hypothetical protein [Bacteriovorax sp. PP10]
MKFIIVLLLLQSSLAFAAKKTTEKDLSLLGRIDESSLKMEPTLPKNNDTETKSTFSMSCKDSAGKVFNKEEPGYDACLAGIKAQHDMNKLNPGQMKKDNTNTNNATFNYQIGQ